MCVIIDVLQHSIMHNLVTMQRGGGIGSSAKVLYTMSNTIVMFLHSFLAQLSTTMMTTTTDTTASTTTATASTAAAASVEAVLRTYAHIMTSIDDRDFVNIVSCGHGTTNHMWTRIKQHFGTLI